jgi:hypothetical protein
MQIVLLLFLVLAMFAGLNTSRQDYAATLQQRAAIYSQGMLYWNFATAQKCAWYYKYAPAGNASQCKSTVAADNKGMTTSTYTYPGPPPQSPIFVPPQSSAANALAWAAAFDTGLDTASDGNNYLLTTVAPGSLGFFGTNGQELWGLMANSLTVLWPNSPNVGVWHASTGYIGTYKLGSIAQVSFAGPSAATPGVFGTVALTDGYPAVASPYVP